MDRGKLLLPEYIAARFNLHIRHVHKGLLLGTGPLIDPGFSGRILIPLHNLTDNDYELSGGDGIIWVEFTKLSKNEFWSTPTNSIRRPLYLKEFPQQKDIYNPDKYLQKSGVLEASGIQSAFKGALDTATESAKKAEVQTDEIRRTIRNIGIIALLGIVLAVGAFLYQGFSFVGQIVDSAQEQNFRQIEFDRKKQSNTINLYRERITTLEARMALYEEDIENLKKQVDSMMAEKEEKHSLDQ